jgi:hypothetical protein
MNVERSTSEAATEVAGLALDRILERAPYPGVEVETNRLYLLAHKPQLGTSQAVRSASIVATETTPSTARASPASRVTNASACNCVSATYSAS